MPNEGEVQRDDRYCTGCGNASDYYVETEDRGDGWGHRSTLRSVLSECCGEPLTYSREWQDGKWVAFGDAICYEDVCE